jgi:hypothetical protein
MAQHSTPLHARLRVVMVRVVTHAVCTLAALDPALAQEQGRVTIDANRCLELESPDERLACFEAQVKEAESAGSTAPVAAGVPAASPEQAIPTVDNAVPPGQGDAPRQTEWVGTIVSLKEREPNQYVITLDNGQVWQQQGAMRYGLRVGQRVRIYESRFGQRLQADGVNGFIHVDRVR